MSTRLEEFATGQGFGVVVDHRMVKTAGVMKMQPYVHKSADCGRRTRSTGAVYPNERMARSAIPGIKPCPSCHPAQ